MNSRNIWTRTPTPPVTPSLKKKFLALTVCGLLLFAGSALGASAQAPAQAPAQKTLVSETTTDYPNGLTVTTAIYTSRPVASPYSSRTTVSADRTSEGSIGGEVVWSYTISGDFTYDGVTARASNPSDDYAIYGNWFNLSHSVRASGASILGSATFRSDSGVTRSVSPRLTCSPNGDFS